MRVDHRRRHVRVAEQLLHRADVVAGFQQVRREAVPQRVAAEGPRYPGAAPGDRAEPPSGSGASPKPRAAYRSCMARTLSRCASSAVRARREHGDAILSPLPLVDRDPVALEFQVADAQARALREPQAGSVEEFGHERADSRHGVRKAAHLAGGFPSCAVGNLVNEDTRRRKPSSGF